MPRAVLRDQYQSEIQADEEQLVLEFEEGFDRADFRAEFSPSPNVEGPQPQPRDNVSRDYTLVSSSPPRARTNNDGKSPITKTATLLTKRVRFRGVFQCTLYSMQMSALWRICIIET